ncbi:hypothetical protein DICA2_D14444 [Diutina catenulata]
MYSYTITSEKAEVYVTGNFDHWRGKHRLTRANDYSLKVSVPRRTRIEFQFFDTTGRAVVMDHYAYAQPLHYIPAEALINENDDASSTVMGYSTLDPGQSTVRDISLNLVEASSLFTASTSESDLDYLMAVDPVPRQPVQPVQHHPLHSFDIIEADPISPVTLTQSPLGVPGAPVFSPSYLGSPQVPDSQVSSSMRSPLSRYQPSSHTSPSIDASPGVSPTATVKKKKSSMVSPITVSTGGFGTNESTDHEVRVDDGAGLSVKVPEYIPAPVFDGAKKVPRSPRLSKVRSRGSTRTLTTLTEPKSSASSMKTYNFFDSEAQAPPLPSNPGSIYDVASQACSRTESNTWREANAVPNYFDSSSIPPLPKSAASSIVERIPSRSSLRSSRTNNDYYADAADLPPLPLSTGPPLPEKDVTEVRKSKSKRRQEAPTKWGSEDYTRFAPYAETPLLVEEKPAKRPPGLDGAFCKMLNSLTKRFKQKSLQEFEPKQRSVSHPYDISHLLHVSHDDSDAAVTELLRKAKLRPGQTSPTPPDFYPEPSIALDSPQIPPRQVRRRKRSMDPERAKGRPRRKTRSGEFSGRLSKTNTTHTSHSGSSKSTKVPSRYDVDWNKPERAETTTPAVDGEARTVYSPTGETFVSKSADKLAKPGLLIGTLDGASSDEMVDVIRDDETTPETVLMPVIPPPVVRGTPEKAPSISSSFKFSPITTDIPDPSSSSLALALRSRPTPTPIPYRGKIHVPDARKRAASARKVVSRQSSLRNQFRPPSATWNPRDSMISSVSSDADDFRSVLSHFGSRGTRSSFLFDSSSVDYFDPNFDDGFEVESFSDVKTAHSQFSSRHLDHLDLDHPKMSRPASIRIPGSFVLPSPQPQSPFNPEVVPRYFPDHLDNSQSFTSRLKSMFNPPASTTAA